MPPANLVPLPGDGIIYKATYSSVPVYEMPCQNVAVMRRKLDSWLNATQILKVAGFDKPQRTRVLEREVQKGTHEKVQGGYGKYQGTWVPMERGIALSRQYGVDKVLQPIFDYLPGPDSPPLAPKHITAPPARPKKKNNATNNGQEDSDNTPGSSNLPKAQSSRVQATKAAAAARKAAENRKAIEERKREESEEEHANLMREMNSEGRSLSRTPSEQSEQSETPSPMGSGMGGHQHNGGGNGGDDVDFNDFVGSSNGNNGGRKRKHQEMLPNSQQQQQQNHLHSQSQQHQQSLNQQHQHQQQNQYQQSNHQQQHQQQQHPHSQSQHPHSADSQLGYGPLRYARLILDYFVSETTQIPSFLTSPPPDFDANVVIDDDGHTALHWACAMGRLRIVRLLLSAGADVFRANGMGQTALMRSVMFTNNYDLRKFPELFELLHRSTINIDRNDRTVFHYVVDIALQKGKTHAARYYIETILARLIDYPQEVADILNFQDEEGETALTLAARARSKRLVKILLDNGADPKIANRDGKTAEDYILEDERFRESDITMGGTGPLLSGDLVTSGNNNNGGVSNGGVGGSNGLNYNYGHLSNNNNNSNTSVLPSFVPQLHSSETGQKTSSRCIPEVAQLLEQLANSFDKELGETDRDLQQALNLLTNINVEINDNFNTLKNLELQSSNFDLLNQQEALLNEEFQVKMGKRFRLGWEKWFRDEDARESNYLLLKNTNSGGNNSLPPVEPDLDSLINLTQSTTSEEATNQILNKKIKIEHFVQERQTLFNKLAKLESDVGTGVKLAKYRHLIALGCGVPIDQVEDVVTSL